MLGVVGQQCWGLLANSVAGCLPTMSGVVGQQCWGCWPIVLRNVCQQCWELLANNIGVVVQQQQVLPLLFRIKMKKVFGFSDMKTVLLVRFLK